MDLPNEATLRGVVSAYARFWAPHGGAIGSPVLVQPTGDFFPDEVRRGERAGGCGGASSLDRSGVDCLLRRVLAHAPVASDVDVTLNVVLPAGADEVGGACGSPGCGSAGESAGPSGGVQDRDDGYHVQVVATDVAHPVVLMATLARSAGALVLHEAGEARAAGSPAAAEIAAVACGFGVLLANGAAVWGKSCGGLRVTRATALSVEEMTVALALFVAIHGLPAGSARGHLDATQREAFDLAVAWTESNPLLVENLRDRPAVIAAGTFAMEPVRGLLGRWLYKRSLEKALRPAPTPRVALSEDKRRRLAEAKRLVDEMLAEGPDRAAIDDPLGAEAE